MAIDPLTAVAIGAPVVGGLLSYFGDKSEAEQARAAARERNAAEMAMAERNIALQREFAQNGIRWKVEDAKAAGLHPLYAMGANTHSFNPVAVGVEREPSSPSPLKALGSMGQDVSRAIMSTQTESERQRDALLMDGLRLDNEGKVLENQIRASQLAKMQVGPAMPSSVESENFIPGQGNGPKIKTVPVERAASATGRPAQEAGWKPDVGLARTDKGLVPVIPKDMSEAYESDLLGSIGWQVRNRLMPMVDRSIAPPKHMLPKGYTHWEYSPLHGYVPSKIDPQRAFDDRYRKRLKESRRSYGRSSNW